MQMLKTADIVNMIAQSGTHKAYDYYRRKTKIRITEITKPEGPIKFMRWDSHQSESDAGSGGISINQLGTVASVFWRRPNYPAYNRGIV